MALQSEAVEELNIDISNYWQAYGLSQEPYGLGIDSNLYVALSRWEEHLDLLQYLCNYNNLLLVVTGVAGSGKTTLMQQLVEQLNETAQVCQVHADANFDTSRLLELLAENFSLPWDPEAPLDEQFDAQIGQVQNHERSCVLTIDNAHLLPEKTLEALLYFVRQQSDAQMRLHIILFGEPVLQDTLAQLTEEDEVELVHALNLESLDLEETHQYLEQRLAAVGWQDSMPFSADTVSRIYRLSEGVPARVNRIARRTLLDKITKEQESNDVGFLTEHKTKIWGAGFIILALLAFGFILNQMRHESVPPLHIEKQATVAFEQTLNNTNLPAEPALTETQAKPVAMAPTVNNTATTNNTVAAKEMTQITPAATQNSVTPSTATLAGSPANNSTSGVVNTTAAAPTTTTSQKPAAIVLDPVPAETPMAVTQATPDPVDTDPATTTATVAVPNSTTEQIKPTLATPIVNAEKVEPAIVTSAARPAVTKAATPLKQKPELEVKAGSYSNDEHLLLKIPGNHYTIQVIGLSREANIRKLIRDNNLTDKAHYFRTNLNGKNFYILIYGNYLSRQEAAAAINSLPAALQAFKPWPRDFARIHASLQKRQF